MSLTAHCQEDHLLEAWKLMQFLGGKDATGDYYTARTLVSAPGPRICVHFPDG